MSFTPVSSIAPATVTVGGTVAVSNFPASQAVTGPLTDTQLRATALPVSGPLTDAQIRASALPVSGTVAVSGVSGTVTVDGSGHTQPVSGTVAVSGSVAVTGGLTDTQLRASAVPISAAALPLPSGAATAAAQTDGSQRVGGTVAVSGPLTDTQLRATALPVSGPLTDAQIRATALPVSGTVTANQGTAGVAWPISAAALPLPSGAAKDSTLTDSSQRVGGTVTVDASGVAVPVTGPLTNAQLRASAVPVDGSAVTQPVSGTVAATVASLPLPSGAATEATLKRVNGAVQDSALTAALDREKIPA